jgi:hypothetical protein
MTKHFPMHDLVKSIVEASAEPLRPSEIETRVFSQQRASVTEVRDAILNLVRRDVLRLTPDRKIAAKQ